MTDEGDPWGPFDTDSWERLPHVQGRLATEDDVRAGCAVFHQSGPDLTRRPADMFLPRRARLDGSDVVVIQAEWARDAVVVGYRVPAGGNGVALLEQLELGD